MSSTPSSPADHGENSAPASRSRAVKRAMVTTLLYDIGLSVMAYFAAELLGATTYVALLAGTVVTGARMLWVAARQRRVDPFALFLLFLFGASLALSFTSGGARFILAKDCAQSAVAGLVLVGSCAVRRPLAYYAALRFARQAGTRQAAEFQARAGTATMRARWRRVTLVWGTTLLIDASLRIAAVYLLPIEVASNVSQLLMFAFIGGLVLWTVRSMKREHTGPQGETAVGLGRARG
ncbi:VC0807 family protein [Streptomyces sp. NPDC058157]|uniref:VC0807 family protein n=1 Tax=Streptomyces sp. NPDC058157 TaxID=3346360 RepID=UPI0036E6864D